MSRTCCGRTKPTGDPCLMAPLVASDYCWAHDPLRGKERAEARRKGGLNRRTPTSMSTVALQLRDVEAIQRLLEDTIGDTLLQENSAQRSRTIGYLLGLALRIVEVGELEQRISALEGVARAGKG